MIKRFGVIKESVKVQDAGRKTGFFPKMFVAHLKLVYP